MVAKQMQAPVSPPPKPGNPGGGHETKERASGMAVSFKKENKAFENWLRRRCKVVEADLAYKHKRMRKSAFVFLRATYFRWAKRIETICPEYSSPP